MECIAVTSHRLKYNGRIDGAYRRWLYVIACATWITGALWLLFHHFLMRSGPFGATPHPAEPWLLKVHGAAAFLATWIFGLIWGVHVSKALPFKKRKASGLAVVVLTMVLIVTGYLLYYVGGDAVRQAISISHWAIGLAAPAILFLHWSRKWQRRLRRSKIDRDGAVRADFKDTIPSSRVFDIAPE